MEKQKVIRPTIPDVEPPRMDQQWNISWCQADGISERDVVSNHLQYVKGRRMIPAYVCVTVLVIII